MSANETIERNREGSSGENERRARDREEGERQRGTSDYEPCIPWHDHSSTISRGGREHRLRATTKCNKDAGTVTMAWCGRVSGSCRLQVVCLLGNQPLRTVPTEGLLPTMRPTIVPLPRPHGAPCLYKSQPRPTATTITLCSCSLEGRAEGLRVVRTFPSASRK